MGDKIRYGERSNIRSLFSYLRHTITDPVRYFSSISEPVTNFEVGCAIPVWNESDTIGLALESSMHFVTRYVVIDKNGETIPTIKKIEKKYGLNIDYYIKPDLNLLESRRFGLEKIHETWILMLDGDEVLIPELLLQKMKYKNTYIRSCKNIIHPKNMTQVVNNGFHNILLHNNGTVFVPEKFNIPRMKGRAIYLDNPCIFNLHLNKERGSGAVMRRERKLVPYNDQIQGKIPDIITKFLQKEKKE
ncbi:hypothetical protein HN807_00480 [Candidatus Bathyarchaeota archaeon]|nr:hypothetical protein [Candidatus Bathyarchaeota archaeon]MBT3284632.1 hypothetical protein [Candidatus Bathyarchaeota archaeon]MBT4321032.1 hypothetical protein [Candidatus Bathyarchaeota archaeon]MBT4425088.1 hypothetical protein [Candidatus Bathyarchaeota archaeon]MBT6605865.1 hypothetical protein [Candidatus Bathyarchaeota archaeon]